MDDNGDDDDDDFNRDDLRKILRSKTNIYIYNALHTYFFYNVCIVQNVHEYSSYFVNLHMKICF